MFNHINAISLKQVIYISTSALLKQMKSIGQNLLSILAFHICDFSRPPWQEATIERHPDALLKKYANEHF